MLCSILQYIRCSLLLQCSRCCSTFLTQNFTILQRFPFNKDLHIRLLRNRLPHVLYFFPFYLQVPFNQQNQIFCISLVSTKDCYSDPFNSKSIRPTLFCFSLFVFQSTCLLTFDNIQHIFAKHNTPPNPVDQPSFDFGVADNAYLP